MNRMPFVLSVWLALLSAAAAAGEPAPAARPLSAEIATSVSPDSLQQSLMSLVGFGTRHTLSDTQSDSRGIGAARRWAKSRFEAFSHDCQRCLQIDMPSRSFSGDRLPQPAAIADVVAIQRGTTDPQRVILITAHIDSRVSDVMNATADAPGADDDGSGVALVL